MVLRTILGAHAYTLAYHISIKQRSLRKGKPFSTNYKPQKPKLKFNSEHCTFNGFDQKLLLIRGGHIVRDLRCVEPKHPNVCKLYNTGVLVARHLEENYRKPKKIEGDE
ncbi:hypothetical protein RJ639_010394 [Escallonia herrerae]|uniref:Uncharacterized protein n=1 Tax=Escallonia herrerae TaxID=1293975 RepID=A0AA88VPZ6_9ASTE|nr:hypothetical protein RJ639_010394 [Escallonia herrerae]